MATTETLQRVTFKAAFRTVDDAGEFEAILSAPTIDRDGEVIDSKAFEPLPEVMPIHRDHDMTTRGLVGYATPFYDEDGLLRAKGTFFSDADGQRMRLYAKTGILSMSVGFMAAERSRDAKGIPHVTRAELLEASFVSVPSNRDASVTSVKDATSPKPVDRKSINGSYEHTAEKLQQALRVRAGEGNYLYVTGTFSDSVVYQQWDSSMNLDRTYMADWSETDGVLTIGQPVEVEVSEVVTPASKSASEAEAEPVATVATDRKSLDEWLAISKDLKEATK